MDSAVGTIAKVVDAARDMLATTTAFRTWQGNSWTVEQAKTRIYRQSMPLVADASALEALRPFAVIWLPINSVTWRRQAAINAFRPRGSMTIELHRTPATLDSADPGALERTFVNFLGALVRSGDSNNPGLCELSGQAGFLHLVEVRADGPYRADPEDLQTVGDAELAYLELEWD